MGQVKYKAYLRRRFQPVGKQQEFLSKIVTVCCCHSVTIMKDSNAMTTAYRHYPIGDIYV